MCKKGFWKTSSVALPMLAIASMLAVSMAGCAPAPATPPPTTAAAPSPMAIAPQVATSLSPEEAAWGKVVKAAKKEGKVTVYTYQWVGDIGLDISRAFKKRYGINLEIIAGRGVEQVERLKTEKRIGQRMGDILDQSAANIGALKMEGLLTSVGDELPSLREKGVWLVEPTSFDQRDKTVLMQRVVTQSAFINTNLVKQEDIPRSWKDLLDPKWKGKMSIADPNLSIPGHQFMVVLMEHKAWDEEYIKALYKQDLHLPVSSQEEALMLSRGEFFLSISLSDAAASRPAQEGAPIQALDMKEGVVLGASGQGAIADSPHPNATRVLLNWLFSKEGMTIVSKAMTNKMVRNDVPDFRLKAVRIEPERPLVVTMQNVEKANQLLKEKWLNKLVGR